MKLWTVRLFSLARLFDGFDPELTTKALSSLISLDHLNLRFSSPGEKRTRQLASWAQLKNIQWEGKLVVSALTKEGVEFSGTFWRFRGNCEDAPDAANFQANELAIDFPSQRITSSNWTMPEILHLLLKASNASSSELAIMGPSDPEMLRQVYRERGLAEGIPGIFDFTVLGGVFGQAIDASKIRAMLGNDYVANDDFGVAFTCRKSIAVSSDVDIRNQLRHAIGEQFFAGPRIINQESSGMFGISELFSMFKRNRNDDKAAQGRSSKYKFPLDWSGLFIK